MVSIQGLENHERIAEIMRKMEVDTTIRAYNPKGEYHFADNSISATQSLVRWISSMPISVYLAASLEESLDTKQEKDDLVYKSFFPKILQPQILKYSRRLSGPATFKIIFENLSDKKNVDAKYFSNIIQSLSLPSSVEVQVRGKNEEPLSFLPDYYLGFLNKRLLKNEWAAESFKLMADKVGLLLFLEGNDIVRYERGETVFNYLTNINS